MDSVLAPTGRLAVLREALLFPWPLIRAGGLLGYPRRRDLSPFQRMQMTPGDEVTAPGSTAKAGQGPTALHLPIQNTTTG